ncbi:MAG: oxyanion-translocating ATPase [Actinomycetia bacterium]|jgi:anion-transporting  ArsA/GET3 family ATPase|nr:oxyanion-translocating ATPase [Actinomycetes bacterium]
MPASPSPGLLDRRLLFVTGKGGVGKSTVAAALAMLAADHGKRVLLVEVDAKGNLTDLFERPPVGFKPEVVAPGVSAMTMNTDSSLQEYLKLNLRIPVMGKIGPVARMLDFVASAAPGVRELLTVGKICWEVRESMAGRADWDLVVVDAAATGHIISQLDAPRSIRELVQVGMVREQTEWMAELLADPAITALNIVATPEEMPVSETIQLVGQARAELDVPLGAVIVNRVLPELFTRADEATFNALREREPSRILEERVGPGSTAVLDAAWLAVDLRRTRATYLTRLRTEVDLPMLYLPYLFVRGYGLRVIRMMATSLGEELGL